MTSIFEFVPISEHRWFTGKGGVPDHAGLLDCFHGTIPSRTDIGPACQLKSSPLAKSAGPRATFPAIVHAKRSRHWLNVTRDLGPSRNLVALKNKRTVVLHDPLEGGQSFSLRHLDTSSIPGGFLLHAAKRRKRGVKHKPEDVWAEATFATRELARKQLRLLKSFCSFCRYRTPAQLLTVEEPVLLGKLEEWAHSFDATTRRRMHDISVVRSFVVFSGGSLHIPDGWSSRLASRARPNP